MSHEDFVYLAKTLGLIWMLGFFVIVVIRAFNPRRRAAYDRAARSILPAAKLDDREGRP